tara:strand:- start:1725 stop:2483 length:759 start_codon:yes stop_codon:yes gene_type:complete
VITDPYFYVVAVISVFLHGMAKGGFAGSLALLAIPMMAFFIPPFQAVAILLIPLIFMDFVTVYRYRGMWDWSIVKYIIPLGILGVIIGTITFKFMSEDHIRILVGILAIAFSLDYFLRSSNIQPKKTSPIGSYFWPTLSGFTSFSIHAGGLPLSFYLLPKRLDRRVYAATMGIYFLAMNLFKIFPYAYLEQMTYQNISTSLILLPLAPIGVYFGAYMVEKVGQEWFYRISYFCLLIAGTKLIYDGKGSLFFF